MTALPRAEIEHLQRLRAKNMVKKVTLQETPFDRGKVVGEGGVTAAKPAPKPMEYIATKCLTATLNANDLRYMALAILQMQDTICELRQRVRILEAGSNGPGKENTQEMLQSGGENG